MSNLFLEKEKKELERLQQEVKNCYRCDIATSCTQKVFGEGPLGTKVMSIAEAPGEEEDRTGKPFSGRAGKYWEQMLQNAGLSRTSLWVCNVLCCRPVGNKIEPDYHQIHNCTPYLARQLSIIKPQLIIAFGKVAAYGLGLLPNKTASVGSVLGVWSKRTGSLFQYGTDSGNYQTEAVVTYHPSYLMRPGKDKENWLSYLHLSEARSVMNGLVNRSANR
jgi:uracil-DNA glycosylase